ncbi:sulfotransferase [Mangrovimonas xylaniphaga]|uniref:sulfotransferase n=1 Tax=Mangrovimonas xylaniphaga TaxID=1645915 RepID=UPI0006B5E3EF|nr:sulfotransferase [Mangrovimonas xylaniphaga]
MNRVIILLGQRVRSGTNFVGSTLLQHPKVVTLPRGKSFGEFNLFNDNAIVTEVFDRVIERSFGMRLSKEWLPTFLENYGKNWLSLLQAKYEIPKDAVLFFKSPRIDQIDLWLQAFPEAQILVVCRDGRDNVVSSVKASNDKRSWYTFFIILKKFINYYSGRSFVNHAREWAETADYVIDVKQSLGSRVKVLPYESLLNSRQGISDLLDHFKLDINENILKACMEAPVIGSSQGVHTSNVKKTNWQPDYNKSKYMFTKKWRHWGVLKKIVFKTIAGKQLVALNYEKNSTW